MSLVAGQIRVAAGEEEKVGFSFRFPLCLFQIVSSPPTRISTLDLHPYRCLDRTSEFIPTVENRVRHGQRVAIGALGRKRRGFVRP